MPRDNDFELILFGPGYGESMVLHVGDGNWLVVDSVVDSTEKPVALRYLEDLGVRTSHAIKMVVATHWHDDHIKGLENLVKSCPNAEFCCAGALAREEFLTLIAAAEKNHNFHVRSGLRELYGVFSYLTARCKTPIYATENKIVFSNEYCKVLSLSPSDTTFQHFLHDVASLLPNTNEPRKRIPSLSPNDHAVVLWVELGEFAVLLGSDLETQGWITIIANAKIDTSRASMYKVAHHGSVNAHEPSIWSKMLEEKTIAVLTPWRLAGGELPSRADVRRILSVTQDAYLTSLHPNQKKPRFPSPVERTLRESGIQLQRRSPDGSYIHLSHPFKSSDNWSVDLGPNATHLKEYQPGK